MTNMIDNYFESVLLTKGFGTIGIVGAVSFLLVSKRTARTVSVDSSNQQLLRGSSVEDFLHDVFCL